MNRDQTGGGKQRQLKPYYEQQNPHLVRRLILLLVLIAATIAVFYLAALSVPEQYWLLGIHVLVIVLASILPAMIYGYFIQGRGRILYREYELNLRRLGYPYIALPYREKFEAIYGAIRFQPKETKRPAPGENQGTPETPSGPTLVDQAQDSEETEIREVYFNPFNSPVVAATLLTFVGWVLVYLPRQPGSLNLLPDQSPMAYGFLGAYVFGVGSLVRQYVTDDLQPRYYASLSVRYITVFALSWLITMIAPLADQSQALVIAFFIGLFPSEGLRLAVRAAESALGHFTRAFKEDQPLNLLDGLNAYQEDRLNLEGIDNMQNLACANIVELMLKTRFSVDQIVDWIDQSLLWMHVDPTTAIAFREAGFRTATDFLDMYDETKPTDIDARATQRTEQRTRIADLVAGKYGKRLPAENRLPLAELTATLLNQFDALAIALRTDPNMLHIRYWRSHAYEALPEDIERLRISADLQLLQGLSEKAIELYDSLLRDYPTPSVLLYRGLAHYSSGEFVEALDDYTQAIQLGGKQWSNIRYAYIERGRALYALEEFKLQEQNYNEALTLFPDFHEARFQLAVLLSDLAGRIDVSNPDHAPLKLDLYEQAIKHFDKIIADEFKERVAEALGNRGIARYQRWKNRPADQRLPQDLESARDDLASALHRRSDLGWFYISLAQVYGDLNDAAAQEQVLTRALEGLKKALVRDVAYRARLDRGYLYLLRRDFQKAADDFQAATQIFDERTAAAPPASAGSAAYAFLGEALRGLRDWPGAIKALSRAVALDPKLTTAHFDLGGSYLSLKQYEKAEQSYLNAQELAREANDPLSQARAHLGLSRAYRNQGRWDDARREANRAVQLARNLQDELYTEATCELGLALKNLGDITQAVKCLSDCAVLFDVLGQPRRSAAAYYQWALAESDLEKKRTALDKALEQIDTIFDPRFEEDVELRQSIQDARSQLPPAVTTAPG